MKKKILALLLFFIVAVMSGCSQNVSNATVDVSSGVTPNLLSTGSTYVGERYYYYIIDTNTGVVYLANTGYNCSAISVMLNRDGSPITAEQLGIEY